MPLNKILLLLLGLMKQVKAHTYRIIHTTVQWQQWPWEEDTAFSNFFSFFHTAEIKKQREFYQKLGMEVPGDIKGELCNMKTHLDQRNGTVHITHASSASLIKTFFKNLSKMMSHVWSESLLHQEICPAVSVLSDNGKWWHQLVVLP